MTDFLERWANETPENAKLVAQELLIAETTEVLWEAMKQAGVTKSDLAKRMGTTKGHISQVLGGSRNMTLRTFSDICHALDLRPTITIHARRNEPGWQTFQTETATHGRPKLRYPQLNKASTGE